MRGRGSGNVWRKGGQIPSSPGVALFVFDPGMVEEFCGTPKVPFIHPFFHLSLRLLQLLFVVDGDPYLNAPLPFTVSIMH